MLRAHLTYVVTYVTRILAVTFVRFEAFFPRAAYLKLLSMF